MAKEAKRKASKKRSPIKKKASAKSLPPNARAADARAPKNLVEKSFVGPSSTVTYLGQLVRFAVYLFDNHKDKLTDEHLEKMTAADNKDKSEKNNKRTALRNYIVQAADAIKPLRVGQHHNSFIKIDEENSLDYDTVVEYMNTKYNIVEVERSCAEKYLKEINITDEITPDTEVNDCKVRLKIFQSIDKYNGIRSAVMWVYKAARVDNPFAQELGTYLKGIDRHIKAAKQHLGLKLTKGKAVLKPEAFEMIAKHLFQSGEKRDIFCLLVFLLDWNLMKRSENCMNAQMIHIEFENDYLKFTFEKEKGKQHGDMHGPWHCFANPKKPHLCLVLAFARYIFAFPDVLQAGKPLFSGLNQYRRYSSRMLQLFLKLKDDLFAMGIDWRELGTHSARKGVGSMVANASTIGPPIVALCLRQGWTLGGVKETYLFRQDAGDMNVGRRAACLDVETKEFAISPPYFDCSDLDEEGKGAFMNKVEQWLKERIPKADNIPANTWHLAKMCFASLCYNYSTLLTDLDVACPLRFVPVFQSIPEEFKNRAKVAYPWNKTRDTPEFSGIPPHVLHLAKMETLEKKIDRMGDGLMARIIAEFDSRGFSSTEYKTSAIKEIFTSVVEDLTSDLRSELKEVKETIRNCRHEYISDVVEAEPLALNTCTIIDEDVDVESPSADDTNGALPREAANIQLTEQQKQLQKRKRLQKCTQAIKKRKLLMGYHHNKLSVLPREFTFPSMSVQSLVSMYLVGDVENNIPPLASLRSSDVMHFKTKKGVQTGNRVRGKMNAVMRIVEEYARRKGVWVEKICNWTPALVTKLWDGIGDEFEADFCKSNRSKDLAWTTIFTRMTNANAFHNPRNKLEKAKRAAENNAV